MPDTKLGAGVETKTHLQPAQWQAKEPVHARGCKVAVIWIDWYAYHVARFLGLSRQPDLAGQVVGLELVGGVGVHAGLRFREERPAGLPIETLFPGENWHGVGQVRVARRLWHRLTELDPEVVLVPGYYTLPALAAACWARVHGRKSVLMTESTEGDHQRSGWKEAAKSLLLRALFGWAVAGGERHIDYLRVLRFPRERIARFYDVVDNEGLYTRSRELQRGGRASFALPEPYFLYVGRLAPEKNIAGLLDAFASYRLEGGSRPLLLVGDGPERRELEAHVERCKLTDAVHFVGHKGSAELPLYYAFAHCFVLPSTREPWGLVVNEAMACGLPVIVSDRCGCAQDLVTGGENGFVFSPKEPERLVDALRAMDELSREQWLGMAAHSLQRIANYSPDHFGEQIARIVSA